VDLSARTLPPRDVDELQDDDKIAGLDVYVWAIIGGAVVCLLLVVIGVCVVKRRGNDDYDAAGVYSPNTFGSPSPVAQPGSALNIEWIADDEEISEEVDFAYGGVNSGVTSPGQQHQPNQFDTQSFRPPPSLNIQGPPGVRPDNDIYGQANPIPDYDYVNEPAPSESAHYNQQYDGLPNLSSMGTVASMRPMPALPPSATPSFAARPSLPPPTDSFKALPPPPTQGVPRADNSQYQLY